MLPQRSSQLQKDWFQILIGLVWFTVVLIMLLSKMKAIQDVLLLAFLCGATAVQNAEQLVPWLVADKTKKFDKNFIAVRKHVRFECLYSFLITWSLLEVVHLCGTRLETESWLFFGWTFCLVTSVLYHSGFKLFGLSNANQTWLFNPVITLALLHGTKSTGNLVISDIQAQIYIGFQVTGMVLGLLLHCVRTSGTDYLSLFHTLEPNFLAVTELVIACAISYLVARMQITASEKAKGEGRRNVMNKNSGFGSGVEMRNFASVDHAGNGTTGIEPSSVQLQGAGSSATVIPGTSEEAKID